MSDRILILGGGHVGQVLSEMCAIAGLRHAVVDDRPSYSTPERFPRADRLVCKPFPEGLALLEPDPGTAVVIATRCHQFDLACLEAALDTDAGYIGLVGSRTKVATILRLLRSRGIDAARDPRVFAPVGLDLGGKSPAEISLSIVAELLATGTGM